MSFAPPIAVISHAHPSISKGGAEIAAATLFSGLRTLGVPAILIAAVPERERHRLDLGADEYAVFHDQDRYEHLYQLAEPAVPRQLCAILDATGAEQLVFHHFLWLGLNSLREALALPGRRAMLVLHEFLAQCHNHGQMITTTSQLPCRSATASRCATCFPALGRPRFELRRRVVGEVFDRLDGFISPSRFLADRYIEWGVPAERMHVVENGLLQPALAMPGEPAGHRRGFVFGFFGQLNPFKGVDVLLAAAERLAAIAGIEIRIHGNVIGLPEAFQARLDRLGEALPQLRIMGAYENDQVGALMQDCDYVVVPSIWWENSPVVIQEAYAAGRPVICSGIGGMAEKVVPGVSGLHFRRGDAADLAQVMQAAANPETLAKLRTGLPQPADAPTMARHYLAAMGLQPAEAEAAAPARKPRRAAARLPA